MSDDVEDVEEDEEETYEEWTLDGRLLIEMLHRCYGGEAPDMVYLEMYANCYDDDEGEET